MNKLTTVMTLGTVALSVLMAVAVLLHGRDLISYAASPVPYAIYESCLPITSSSCLGRLDQMAAAGFKYVINYDQMNGAIADELAYADHANQLGMKVIWAMHDPIWWKGNAAVQFGDLTASLGGASSSTELAKKFVERVKSHPATWGYYVGDETIAAEHTVMKAYSDTVHAADPVHPRLFISAEDCATKGSNLQPFADVADVIGSDFYPWPRTDCPAQETVKSVAQAVQQLANENTKQSAYVVQAFSWAQYNETWVCSPFPACAVFPSVSQMQQEKDTVLANMQPAMVLWYSFFDIWNTDQYNKMPLPRKSQQDYWSDVIAAAGATGNSTGNPTTQTPVPHTDTPSPSGPACKRVLGDANGDGKVNLTDFEVWRRVFLGQLTPSSGPTDTPVPNPTSTTAPSPTLTTAPGQIGLWKPSPDKPIHWHWQLSQDFQYPRDVVPGATVYDIDGEKTTAQTVSQLHALGPDVKVICYFDAGVYEDYRSDASSFPKSVIGQADTGWAGSYWLDIRQQSILLPIMQKRMQNWCKDKGFDAIEPDETEVWSNNSGFPITKADNNSYNQAIANMAHSLGMSVALKGNTTEAPELWQYFDFSINEQCWEYSECANMWNSFIANGKAVFNIEYNVNPDCTQSNQHHMNSARRDLNLVGPTNSSYLYQPCVVNTVNTW